MKIKTAELTGPALDWAVARCEGYEYEWVALYRKSRGKPNYSIDWAQGGPIIERERIELHNATATDSTGMWVAHGKEQVYSYGPTPLFAAMRCFVIGRYGDMIDVPEELLR